MDYNIYIDESCHLERDGFPVMAIGYVKIANQNKDAHISEIKEIMKRHKSFSEIKWTSVSPSRLELYKSIVDYFFEKAMYFRCIVTNNKQNLNHEKYNDGDHGKYYFKLVFLLIDAPINPPTQNYNVFIDVKDHKGKERINGIEKVLASKYFNFSPFKKFQHIHSHDSIFMQLSDLLIGAITYKLRGEHLKPTASVSKKELISHIESKIHRQIETTTRLYDTKFNVFTITPINENNG